MSETDWGQIVGGAAEGALSTWLDSPNDESVSSDVGAATAGGNSRPETTAVAQSSGQAQTGNTGWQLPKGNSLLMLGGLALAGIVAVAVIAD